MERLFARFTSLFCLSLVVSLDAAVVQTATGFDGWYTSAGASIVSIVAGIDEHGRAGLDSHSITDSPAAPHASFTHSPGKPMIGGLLEFDAGGSSDTDGHVILYQWDWGDGQTDTAVVPTITHIYDGTPALDTVTLTVTDNDGLTNSTSTELDLRLENGDILLCRSYQSFAPGFWSHAGIYNKPLNRVIEARPEGVGDFPLHDWTWPAGKTCVRAFRVSADQAIRDQAVTFATGQRGKEYDWFLGFGKQAEGQGPLAGKWYGSELIWAAYFNASGGEIDLDSWRWGPSITPTELEQSSRTEVVGEHMESVPNTIYTEPFGGCAFSPVDLVITNPAGLILSKNRNEIPGARYEEDDVDGDGVLDDLFCIPEPTDGTYVVLAVAVPGVSPDKTYLLTTMFGHHARTLAADIAIRDIPPAGYHVRVPLGVAAVHRFWSPADSRHFYTIRAPERDKLINDYTDVWTYEDLAWYAWPDARDTACLPVHRFWSEVLNAHFYTISETEKSKLISNYPHIWTYEGLAFYAYPEGIQPPEAIPVYRLWSDSLSCHFYTMSQAEKDKLLNNYPGVWSYEGIAWYAFP